MDFLSRATLVAAASAFALSAAPALADWQPDRPINIIVPWGAGGSTDQVTRATVPILEDQLGVSVVVVNQPGASGAVGTQEVLNAPRDGYTWTANAIANNATYSVTGLVPDTSVDDWHVYLTVANVAVVGVPADSEFEDFGQLLEAFRERGSEITVATAGVTSSGGGAGGGGGRPRPRRAGGGGAAPAARASHASHSRPDRGLRM
jgi:tripartite-type tricarboxylate transporter receptor subunit TctC